MAAPTFVAEYEGPSWTTTTTPKTASVTVANGDVLFVLGAVENASGTLGTPTGGSLTYTSRANIGTANSNCRVALWTAPSASGQSFTLSETRAGSTVVWGMTSARISGSDGFGTAVSTTAGGSQPSLGITTTQANSGILVIIADWNAVSGTSYTYRAVNGSAPTELVAGAGTAGSNYRVWVLWYADAGAAGAKTVGMTAPSGQDAAMIAIEVKGTAGASPTNSAPTGLASGEVHGTTVATMMLTVVESPGIATALVFGSPTLSAVLSTGPTAIASGQALGTPTVSGVLTSSPSGIATGEAHGSPIVATTLTCSPGGVASAEAFGSPTHTNVRTMVASAVASSEAHGSPTVSTTGPSLSAQPVSIGSAEGLGLPSASSLLAVGATAIPTGEALGSPSAPTVLTSTPVGIATALVLGNPTLTGLLQATANGITTGLAFGTTAISTISFSVPTAIGPGEAFGTTVVSSVVTLSPGGVGSALAFGVLVVNAVQNTVPTGVSSALAFGLVVADFRITSAPSPIASAVALGSPIVTTQLGASPSGVGSGQAFGAPTAVGRLDVAPVSIGSLVAMGIPSVQTPYTAVVLGIGTIEAWGSPLVTLTAASAGLPGARKPRVKLSMGEPRTRFGGGSSSGSLRPDRTTTRRSNGNDGAWITQA